MSISPLVILRTRRFASATLVLLGLGLMALVFAAPFSPDAVAQAEKEGKRTDEAADLAAFQASVGGDITPVMIELQGEPAVLRKVAAERDGQTMSLEALYSYALDLVGQQERFRGALGQRGVRALMLEKNVTQIDGSVRHIEYRFTYLLNGFIAFVANDDLEKLRALPEVAHVSVVEPETYHLDRSIDYSLGTQPDPRDRRTAVYGATQEFTPGGNQNCNPASDPNCHPEAPRTTKIDGFEGQNLNIAIIDSGVDYRHPMFGGIGQGTPLPRVSGQPESPANNKKVIYFYSFNNPVGDPTDDFGHGTLVASNSSGYVVDGNTPPRAGYGTGRDGTGVGPTINGEQLFGTAPQSRIMVYKVCGPAPNCLGDIPLSIEDAASPFTLISSGNPGPTPVAKPVADVINLSLGSTTGDSAATNSRACNNAALAGTIVVASAGNSGPGLGTVGNPGAATLAIAVAASLDPGSVAGSDVLAPNQIPLETCGGNPRPPTCDTGGAQPGPSPEKGRSSNLNAPNPAERQGMRIFPVAGGGPLPVESNPGEPELNTGSLSAHYVFVDRRDAANPIPPSVTNRIALVKGTGAFAAQANSVATFNPAAIILITNIESATAVQVLSGIPTFTISEANGNYLIDRARTGDPGDGDDTVDVPIGTVSELPLRLGDNISLPAFQGVMAGFSSRGPNDHPNANFRILKPDVSAPGVGIVGAATVEGIPDEAVGLASTSGYTSANGTSFSGPITAGAMVLIRQRVREELNLDSTNPADRVKRFDTVTVARALLQNSATNLRSGIGQPQPDGAGSVASINDMGSGHINVAGALTANAIMVSPSLLLTTPNEYTPVPPASGALPVLLPTVSFASVPVVRLNDTIVRTREVIIRDVGLSGSGGGLYNLAVQNNRLLESPGFEVTMTASENSTTPITSINVPPGGQASFFVRVVADGNQILVDQSEFQWYVTATQATSGTRLRMPFYYRAVNAVLPNSAAPNLTAIEGVEQGGSPCPVDTNGNYNVRYTYTGPQLLRFRVQEATFTSSLFFDNADMPLMPGAIGTTIVHENAIWRDAGIPGTPQMPPEWTSEVNPDTGSLAYFIPNAQAQNHSLTMKNTITLPPTGVTLSFTSRESITNNTNFGFVEVSTDNLNYFPVLRVTGTFSGTRQVDLSGFAGQTVRLRFRYQSATGSASGAQGWFVENIGISSDDFTTVAEPAAGETAQPITGRPNRTYLYRVAALYANPNPLDPGTVITGPYSNSRCVTVTGVVGAVSRKIHGTGGTFDIQLPLSANPPIPSMRGIEPRTGGGDARHTVVFQFPQAISSVDSATVTGQTGTPTIIARDSGPGPNEYTVAIGNVANAQTVMVNLVGVRTAAGTNLGNFSVPLGVLLGDTNGDTVVNSGDSAQTRNRAGQLAAPENFRSDVNTDGAINSGDAVIVRRNSGAVLPQ